ncbi:MAG: phosphoribosylformylglycinamidine synthase subunit PurQ [Candidatus Sumerlaeia bacterium]|nr:phosphoribosylformylglycinamidine synthase subunit PurQ [Candidatus Sumerlaeia bacterium]
MRVGILVFPGSNCDQDLHHACAGAMGWEAAFVWHSQALPKSLDLVLVPGGFSHGDYLRCGALAALAPVMADVRRFAEGGGLVLGVCNGFQILCEAGLLPGVLRVNRGGRFRCMPARLRTETLASPFTNRCTRFLTLPIAHKEGNYFADPGTLERLEENDQVLFRYVDAEGSPTPAGNPNGALNNIAGICNAERNVAGLMPHPERAAEPLLGGADGLGLFRSVAAALGALR